MSASCDPRSTMPRPWRASIAPRSEGIESTPPPSTILAPLACAMAWNCSIISRCQKPSPASRACSKRVFVAALTSEAALMLPVAGKIFIFTRWAASFTIRIGAFSADMFTGSCLS